ncbi:class I SAM-dependent methyltransferase [Selenomonas ruminantium]|uniref:class I SAM-dependent methyltransferase n=1 Tax=Selenomonas ruminantium TaxID=971 RepID=UPI0026F1D7AB|nr:class I SAM-dependent methyltransferase [Selenomonas ruminantium]
MAYIDFIGSLHNATKRDYISRVISDDKAECAAIAKQYDYDYWDGERKFGYGGYHYDGRWKSVAEKMVEYYGLKSGQRILDVGCGMAHLLYEFSQVVPGIEVKGIDISDYALKHAKEEIRDSLQYGKAQEIPFEDNFFDLVISLTTLHNLKVFDLKRAVQEIERVSKGNSYIMVESFRNDREEVNMLYWQLTCASYYSVDEWEWLYKEWGYTGDYSFIFFE